MRLIRLTRTQERVVYVNPEHVVQVMPHSSGGTLLIFTAMSNEANSLVVVEDIDFVVAELRG